MNILVIGCGRVGANLAAELSKRGHDVSVLARTQAELDNLSDDYGGISFTGVPFDNDNLMQAGIASCDAVCAVTNDDDINIMVAQLAQEIYRIPMVITRILDPQKEDIYTAFGLKSVCPTKLTIDALITSLDEFDDEKYLQYGSHTLKFFTTKLPKDFVGQRILDIEFEDNEILYAIIHADGTIKLVNNYNVILQEGDTLVFSKVVD